MHMCAGCLLNVFMALAPCICRRFVANKPMLVCGNTASMVEETWLVGGSRGFACVTQASALA